MSKTPITIPYGDGRIETQPAKIDGVWCIGLKDTGIERTVGTTDPDIPGPVPQEYYDVILTFKNIESARLLQDIVNEVVCAWAREISPKTPIHNTAQGLCRENRALRRLLAGRCWRWPDGWSVERDGEHFGTAEEAVEAALAGEEKTICQPGQEAAP